MDKSVTINRKGEISVNRYRHPWIYRSSLDDYGNDVENGDIVRVLTSNGNTAGWGFFSEKSIVAVRLFSIGEYNPGEHWIRERIERSLLLRRDMDLHSNAYRIVNSEGDFFPGLTVDVYGGTVVIKVQVKGVELLVEEIVDVLSKLLPDKKIFFKRDERAARIESMQLPTGYLKGSGDGKEIIEENSLRFLVDFKHGQKTGFYLDQRENRQIAKMFSLNRRVLNLFSYTGAFSIYTSFGNARIVDSVEKSNSAIEIARENEKLNCKKLYGKLNWIKMDVFDFLSEVGEYDFIILDPPPFARRRSELKGAILGYEKINKRVIEKVARGGYIMTFSCSQAVTGSLFKEIIMKQGAMTGRNVVVIKELHAAPDHTFSLYHPEGEYLKGLLVKVW